MRSLLILLALAVATMMFATACPKPQLVVVPDDAQILPSSEKEGWFLISGGHLFHLHEQQLLLVAKLEECRRMQVKAESQIPCWRRGGGCPATDALLPTTLRRR